MQPGEPVKLRRSEAELRGHRDVFMPLKQAPMIGRSVEDSDGLRESVIDFGSRGYLALYRFGAPLRSGLIFGTIEALTAAGIGAAPIIVAPRPRD